MSRAIQSFVTNNPFVRPQPAAVLGGIVGGERPSKYSRSPDLWNRFFDSLNIDGYYTAFDLPEARNLRDFLLVVFEIPGFIDLTITNPYKAAVFAALPSLSWKIRLTERSRVLQSVNHLTGNPLRGEVVADCTDGQGMLRAVKKRLSPEGGRVLLAGAGGAARQIGYEFARAGTNLTIVNIIAEDAAALAQVLAPHCQPGKKAEAAEWDSAGNIAASQDIIISAITSSTPLDARAIEKLPPRILFADVRYGAMAEFALAVRAAGRTCVDGRELLYGQFRYAAETYRDLEDLPAGPVAKSLDDIEVWFCVDN
ncbi:MAG: hypothetical protein LBT68_06940 [Spirochaetales bacterium]|jgi:shikimate dehydrogenase|nr:hypothetical protein [Spirochaetales bacterium]